MMAAASDEGMRGMAELLRSGATMLDRSCPECGSPLFRLRSGEIWCAKCGKRVLIVSSEKDEPREALWDSTENVLVSKISSVERMLEAEEDPSVIRSLADTLSVLLGALERLKRIRD